MVSYKKIIKKAFPFLLPVFRAGRMYVKNQLTKNNISRIIKDRDEIFLELGAGNKKGENNWVTVDMEKNCDIFWDLSNGLPFPDQSVAMMYSSHFFEHLSYNEGQILLDECLRVLKVDGVFSICVPNASLYIKAYITPENNNKDFSTKLNHSSILTTEIDYVNYIAYMDGHHKYMFDENNLIHILKEKGFRNVNLREFDQNIDLKERDYESIYADAIK